MLHQVKLSPTNSPQARADALMVSARAHLIAAKQLARPGRQGSKRHLKIAKCEAQIAGFLRSLADEQRHS